MLKHNNPKPKFPKRTIILGAGGFVGAACRREIDNEGGNVIGVTRAEIDLLEDGAVDALADLFNADDALVMVSANTPCKDNEMLLDNLHMMHAVCTALAQNPVSHIVYISSDAVYADDPEPLTENSAIQPGSMHGIMHVTREEMLSETIGDTPYAILRPTLIYGAADPHNGYGPNRFRRLAAEGQDISLFGEGEERRDHVLIDDVAGIVRRVITHESHGVLNIATGAVTSFREIAEMVAAHFDTAPDIKGTPREGAMPHGGYRPFDPAACGEAFPEFEYKELSEGLARVHQETAGGN